MGKSKKDAAASSATSLGRGDASGDQAAAEQRSAHWRPPDWLFLYNLHGNPKWPDITSQVHRALLMRQKGRMVPLFLAGQFFVAMVCYGGRVQDELLMKLGEAAPPLTFSVVRLLGSLLCVLGSVFLFFVSVFLEPPPDEDGRSAVRATPLGTLLCLTHNIVLVQLVAAVFGLAAELSLAWTPVGWLIIYSHAAPPVLCAASGVFALLFWFVIKDDRQWLQWLEPFERANTGAVEIQYVLHLAPFCLAWADTFLVRDTRMLAQHLPNFWSCSAFLIFCTNVYFGLCLFHSLVSDGCHYYPFLRKLKGNREWARIWGGCAAAITALCALFSTVIRLRAYTA